jgi:hypothetical protein
MNIQLRYVPHSDPFAVLGFWVFIIVILAIYSLISSFKKNDKIESLSQKGISNQGQKNKEVVENNSKYKEIFKRKYNSAWMRNEVQYTGFYRIPISDYDNYDLNIHGYSFFIDNLKNTTGKGKMEVRKNSFEDIDFEMYNLEIIDGFAIFNKKLYQEKQNNEQRFFNKYKKVYITIDENSFANINTGIIHYIIFTPYSVLDWK